jgi:hypothetical protein
VLPNFLVIGAAKSGTTSLWSYLAEHPQIFMARKHEISFFGEADWREQLEWYAAHFAAAQEPLRGEKSVDYSMFPRKPNVAGRIHELIPNAKLIYLVRDPIPRAISHYVQNVVVGVEGRPINKAFSQLDDPTNEYVCTSRYATQLRQYLGLFPAERIFVADQADLLQDRERTLRSIFRFLGADETFRPQNIDRMMMTRERQMKATPFGLHLRTTAGANMIRRLPTPIGAPLAEMARRIFYRRIEQNPSLNPVLRERFAELLRPEVEELREITGMSFAPWSI